MGTKTHMLVSSAPAIIAGVVVFLLSHRLEVKDKKTSPEGDVLRRMMTWFTKPAIGRLPTDLNRMYQSGYQPEKASSLLGY